MKKMLLLAAVLSAFLFVGCNEPPVQEELMPMSAENTDGKVVLRLNVPEKVHKILVYRNQDLRTTSIEEVYMTIAMPDDAEGKVQYFPTGEIKITDRYIKAGEEYSYMVHFSIDGYTKKTETRKVSIASASPACFEDYFAAYSAALSVTLDAETYELTWQENGSLPVTPRKHGRSYGQRGRFA